MIFNKIKSITSDNKPNSIDNVVHKFENSEPKPGPKALSLSLDLNPGAYGQHYLLNNFVYC
jgi:hypothetical protein